MYGSLALGGFGGGSGTPAHPFTCFQKYPKRMARYDPVPPFASVSYRAGS